jgi:hypothetical protein
LPKLGTASPVDLQLTDRERVQFEKFYRNVLDVPGEFLTWLKDRLILDGFELPIGQIQGFAGFVFRGAEVVTNETTASTSYVDLSTVGPELTGLEDGSYAAFFGATVNGGFTDVGSVGLSINGAAPSNASASASTPATVSVTRIKLVSLSADGNNSLKVQYSTSSGTNVSFAQRFLVAVKYANL